MVWPRYVFALMGGACGAAALMLAFIGGVRADILHAFRLPMFWVKLGFPLTLMIGALVASNRLGRPGMKLGRAPAGLLLPGMVIWLIAAEALTNAAPGEGARIFYGVSWKVCSLNIAFVSVPVFGATLWAMNGLAPTRPALAGAASGLLAGTVGAFIYSFYCPETAAPFIAIWYLLGMLIPAVVGAALGARLLRW